MILFGPPGAGKGTQSNLLIDKYNLIHISTGDLFRKHFADNTELGALAQKYMDQGQLVPDDVVIQMVEDRIREVPNATGFILDGFPRTVYQAEAIDSLLHKFEHPLDVVLMLEVPEDELIGRLLNRGRSSGRSDDQNEEKIKTRISVYNEETLPVAEHYSIQGKLRSVDGTGAIDDIFDRLCKAIDQ